MTAATHAGGGALPLALTMGEPAGIGGEIALKAWLALRGRGPAFFLIGDPVHLEGVARSSVPGARVRAIAEPEEVPARFADALPVLPERLRTPVSPGRPQAANASVVIGSIERAVALVGRGRAGAVVTCPIHKRTLYESGFEHPGHTEFLAALSGGEARAVMMLVCEGLRVVPITVHLSLRDAIAALTREAIVACGEVTARALAYDFGIAAPTLAVAGLNPHAGEGGELGREEIEMIGPAVAELNAKGIDARGPMPADTLFHPGARRRYDAVLCMYHDQALIPLKTIDFERGVNVTLGLPFVRTSPDHGTAFDIAGTGRANEASLVAALVLARDMAERRRLALREAALA
ncbi:MAG: 4-hydroxythreonine-4-phosphate dehydrogenase PdxA [Alphaproteobacteria bacterium]